MNFNKFIEIEKLFIYKNINYTKLIKARNNLAKALQSSGSEIEKMGTVQAFEICYELAWKLMRKILQTEGLEFNSPNGVFRSAAKQGIIANSEIWLEYLDKRNITVHAYEEEILDELFHNTAGNFLNDLDKLIEKIQNKDPNDPSWK